MSNINRNEILIKEFKAGLEKHTINAAVAILHKVYEQHRDEIPYKMIRDGWPETDVKSCLDEGYLLWADVVLVLSDGSTYTHCCDIDYASISWATFVSLFNIGVSAYHNAVRNNRDYVHKWFVATCLDWDDWGEDDTIDIVGCSDDEFDDMMAVGVGSKLYHRLDDEDNDSECSFSVGIIGNTYKPEYQSVLTLNDFSKRIAELIKDGYKPLIIQRAADDLDVYETIYWMLAPDYNPESILE